jgi:hypothetical protein
MDLTVYGRQESWEDSPPGWPQQCSITRTNGGGPDWPPVVSVASWTTDRSGLDLPLDALMIWTILLRIG